MSESKLPPGPWRIVWEDPRCATRIRDADGQTVLRIDSRGWRLDASPEVLRAIEAIPEMLKVVEAARKLANLFPPDDPYVAPLRDALALVDGVDRPHP